MSTSLSSFLTTFLTTIGAKLTPDFHCEFNQTQPAPDTFDTDAFNTSSFNKSIIAPLPYYGMLAIEGPDTATFLQGQTTCNINDVNDSHSLTGAYCTAKGRMVSSFRVACIGPENYFLRMRRQIVDNTKNVLGKYIVFSKAQQKNASDDYLTFGLFGPNAQAALTSVFGNAPKQENEAVAIDGNICIQLDPNGQRYECWIRTDQLSQLWPDLSRNLTPVNSRTWELLNIRLGHGEVTEQTVETFIPQMLNYQLTGEISFTKGCYTGQEIVARMHYRGKLKRQMYRIKINQASPAPGTALFKTQGNQSIGNIVNAAAVSDSSCEALAVITNTDANTDQVAIGSELTPVEIVSLPYAINNDDI
jgi:tRNA-modifying protein YgfZ